MRDHLERTVAAMADADVDVLVLGREANARFVSGANRLWLAGTRPFAPGCAVVRRTRAVHLLGITDDGVPSTVPPEHLYPISWNPMNLVGAVAAIPGVRDARRVGVDGMTPLFEQLFHAVLPGAELVDGESLMRDARRVKTADDVAGIRAAAEVARDALVATLAASTATKTPNELKGVFAERMCSHGVTTPAFEPQFTIRGAVVAARAGVIRDGWEASLARTRPADERVTTAKCRPGTSVGTLRALGTTVEGVGMGHEVLADDDVLEPGMVVYVEATHDGSVHGDTVLVTDDDPDVLTAP